MSRVESVLEQIKSLTMVEAGQLVEGIETTFNVSAKPAPAFLIPVQRQEEKIEEQTEFTLVLLDAGATKINTIKTVRELAGLGLKEAKDLVDTAPKTVKDGLSKELAAEWKQKLESAGAKVELK